MYWLDWASDIAAIAEKHILLLNALIDAATPEQATAFDTFIKELRQNLNPEIDRDEAVEMLAQHIITKPVFDAMFSTANFTENNVVSVAIQRVLNELADENVFEAERASLDKFYASVKARVADLDSVSAKQSVIVDLYDHFFKKAFPHIAERLGIVFTPVPVVDYILRSANDALSLTFGKTLSDEGVTILEPFAGTGTFITQLLRSDLIKPEDLERKYKQEIFANEIVLLSYYIATINVESVYSEVANELLGVDTYEPFEGMVLTDTFQINEYDEAIASVAMPENSERLMRQKDADIRVIVMNPPYKAGQKSANDNNANVKYKRLDASIGDTYAKLTDSALKKNLYDSYTRAIRWASDRIKDKGVIAFVSNGSFIDGSQAQGLRKSFANEFSDIFIYNLRGNALGQGEQRQKEAGNVFGEGTRTSVAIAVLVKSGEEIDEACLHYRDIGDYLSREEKLDILKAERSLNGTEWQTIKPNEHGDWINARTGAFKEFQPLVDRGTKGKADTPAIFRNFGLGVFTSRDSWVYNYSPASTEVNVESMIAFYNSEVERWLDHKAQHPDNPGDHVNFLSKDATKFSWDRVNKADVKRGKTFEFAKAKIRVAMYRPFVKQYLYFDPAQKFNNCTYQVPTMFPDNDSDLYPNLAFGGTGVGSKNEFNVMMVNVPPDLETNSKAQWCAFYTYETKKVGLGFVVDGEEVGDFVRRENITDETLDAYRAVYGDPLISKWDIFYYIYGVLNHPQYAAEYASDLHKLVPHIPQVEGFHTFSSVGKQLADLHVDYETAPPYPLDEVIQGVVPEATTEQFDYFAVTNPSWIGRKDRSAVVLNKNVLLRGIPDEAMRFKPNGKAALEWLVERYVVKTDSKSQIVNDANDYSRVVGDPRYIIDLFRRVTTVSVETVRLWESLPPLTPLQKQGWASASNH